MSDKLRDGDISLPLPLLVGLITQFEVNACSSPSLSLRGMHCGCDTVSEFWKALPSFGTERQCNKTVVEKHLLASNMNMNKWGSCEVGLS
jgi:hypothetical protein